MLKPSTTLYPKDPKKDGHVIYDGKPKHRYVQQAAPARYGPSANSYSVKTYYLKLNNNIYIYIIL